MKESFFMEIFFRSSQNKSCITLQHEFVIPYRFSGHAHLVRNSEENRHLRNMWTLQYAVALTTCFYCSLRFSLIVCARSYVPPYDDDISRKTEFIWMSCAKDFFSEILALNTVIFSIAITML